MRWERKKNKEMSNQGEESRIIRYKIQCCSSHINTHIYTLNSLFIAAEYIQYMYKYKKESQISTRPRSIKPDCLCLVDISRLFLDDYHGTVLLLLLLFFLRLHHHLYYYSQCYTDGSDILSVVYYACYCWVYGLLAYKVVAAEIAVVDRCS